jgi:hypothetical protein
MLSPLLSPLLPLLPMLMLPLLMLPLHMTWRRDASKL